MAKGTETRKSGNNYLDNTKDNEMSEGVQTRSMRRKLLAGVKNDKIKAQPKSVKLKPISRKKIHKNIVVGVSNQLKKATPRKDFKIDKVTMAKGMGTFCFNGDEYGVKTRSMRRKELADAEIMIIEYNQEPKRIKLCSKSRSKVDDEIESVESAVSKVFRNPIGMKLIAKFVDFKTLKSLRQVNKGCTPFVTTALSKRSIFVLDEAKRERVQAGNFAKETKKLKGFTSLRLPFHSLDKIRTTQNIILAQRKLFSQLFSKTWSELDLSWDVTCPEGPKTAAKIGKLLEANKNRLVSLKITDFQDKCRFTNSILNFPSTFPNLEHLGLNFTAIRHIEFSVNFGGPVEFSKMFPKLKSLRVNDGVFWLDRDPARFIKGMRNFFPKQVFGGLEVLHVYLGSHFRFPDWDEGWFKQLFPNAEINVQIN